LQNYDWCDEYIKKAQSMMDMNSFDKALDYLKEAEKLDELNHEIYEKKGICYFSKVILFIIFSKFLFFDILIFKKEYDLSKKEFKKALSKEDSYLAKSYLITLSEIDDKTEIKTKGIKNLYGLLDEKKQSAFLNKKRNNK
jgi:hypothetical protein